MTDENITMHTIFNGISLKSSEKYYLLISALDPKSHETSTQNAVYRLWDLYRPHPPTVQNKNVNLEIEPILSREPLHPPNNEVTDDVLLTTAQRRQLERHRLIRANVQVVMVDLRSSREKYQFNKVYARRKFILHDEEVVSGERSLWSVIHAYFPILYFGDYSTSSCKEIILFHSGEERGRQLWQEGQQTSSLLYYAPYLNRNNWHETPTLEDLSDGDRIEIRIAPAIDTDSEPDDYGKDTIIARPRHGPTNLRTQPRSGLNNVLS
jgi:hypothetical protein